MDELQAFIDEQKALDPEFAESFDEGYEQFRTEVLLRQAHENAGLTQEEIADKQKTKSTLSPVSEITRSDVRLYNIDA